MDLGYTLNLFKEIMKIDSPSGYTAAVTDKLAEYASELGYKNYKTNKGNLIIEAEGLDNTKTVGLCAHADTLGLMVRSIKRNGNLAVTTIGGPLIPTLDGEYCTVYTRDGRSYTGTILSTSPSVHVHPDARDKPRKADTIEVRLDEKVKGSDDVQKLGISAGDYICYDPKTVITPSGFIKSRFLDDKLSAAILFGLLKKLKDENVKPNYKTLFMISTYEEIGHGMSHLPCQLDELLSIDMGCIGEDLTCTEFDVSICAKDSSTAYDYEFTSRLINLAKDNGVKYAVDIYPFYGSDATAAMRAGYDVRCALIGPGVAASHGMERSHTEAVENSIKLSWLYLTTPIKG